MGGIAGHAGLFSTVDDLARSAQGLLHDAAIGGTPSMRRLFRPQVASFLGMRSRYLLYTDSRLPSLQAIRYAVLTMRVGSEAGPCTRRSTVGGSQSEDA